MHSSLQQFFNSLHSRQSHSEQCTLDGYVRCSLSNMQSCNWLAASQQKGTASQSIRSLGFQHHARLHLFAVPVLHPIKRAIAKGTQLLGLLLGHAVGSCHGPPAAQAYVQSLYMQASLPTDCSGRPVQTIPHSLPKYPLCRLT